MYGGGRSRLEVDGMGYDTYTYVVCMLLGTLYGTV